MKKYDVNFEKWYMSGIKKETIPSNSNKDVLYSAWKAGIRNHIKVGGA